MGGALRAPPIFCPSAGPVTNSLIAMLPPPDVFSSRQGLSASPLSIVKAILTLSFGILVALFNSSVHAGKVALPTGKGKVVLPPAKGETGIARLAEKVADHYIVLAHERYQDSRDVARQLTESIKAFVRNPSEETHSTAKNAWIKAHSVYSHTEVFRFGNPNVDEWEMRVNAWPMDEGFLDYVSPSYVADEGNPHALQNLIDSSFQIDDGYIIEARSGADPKAGPKTSFTDAETNVATGYHVIEFLLWGQDLNEEPADAGLRSYTDFLAGPDGTNGNVIRRGQYLLTAATILNRDLFDIIQDWDPVKPTLYSKAFRELPVVERLRRMTLGMGSLCNGELAGERILVALVASDQEEEQNCFSDTTHLAIHHNALSIETLYLGTHQKADGTMVEGPSLSDLVASADPDLDQQLKQQMKATRAAAEAVVVRAEEGEPFDQMIRADNEAGREVLRNLIDCLKRQTLSIEAIQQMIPELAAL